MIDLPEPIPISKQRAIVAYDPDRRLAIIDSRGLKMSSMKYFGEFDPSDAEIDAIEKFESEMRNKIELTESEEFNCLSGRQKAMLERWKDYP
jgi:hypothetical protein